MLDHIHMLVINTAETCSVRFHGIPEREEHAHHL
jgi:hypothetical protein